MKEKEKKEKVFKGMTAPVDVVLDIPEDEIWTYKIDGLAEPHINKPFTNFTFKKIVFTVLLLIAITLSMYFSFRVASRTPFEYAEVTDGSSTYEFVKFNNPGDIEELTIDYALSIEQNQTQVNTSTDAISTENEAGSTLVKDESMPISKVSAFCFNCDEKVKTIYIGKDVKEIDRKAFFTCRALQQIKVDPENEYYSDIDGVLYNKDQTEILCYPMNYAEYLRTKYGYNDTIWADNENNLEFRARYVSDVLTYVIPVGVETIGEFCFYDLPIAAIYIPEGVKTIETMAIYRCWYLEDIYSYKSSTAEKGETGFSAVAKLEDVYRSLPDGLEYIASDAMAYNHLNQYIRIPSTVTYIGHHAFWDTVYKNDDNFEGAKEVLISMSEEEFNQNVETGDQWRAQYKNGLLNKKVALVFDAEKIYDEAVTYTEKEDGSYEITTVVNTNDKLTEFSTEADSQKKVTSIAKHAFKWDEIIETVYIGKDVTELYGQTFRNLRALKKITVDKDNPNYCDINGVLYTKDLTTVLCYPAAYEGSKTYVLPSAVTTIGRSAFSDCKLEVIYMPEGLKTIETLAFLKAVNLKEIYSYKADSEIKATDESVIAELGKVYKSLPDGLEAIGVDAFNYASALTYLYIPSSIKDIGAYSFCYCAKIDENGAKAGVTEVDVALTTEQFKNVNAGNNWIPEFRNETSDVATVNYGMDRAAE